MGVEDYLRKKFFSADLVHELLGGAGGDDRRQGQGEVAQVQWRVDKTIYIVLNGDVELLPMAKPRWPASSNGTTSTWYVTARADPEELRQGSSGWCKLCDYVHLAGECARGRVGRAGNSD